MDPLVAESRTSRANIVLSGQAPVCRNALYARGVTKTLSKRSGCAFAADSTVPYVIPSPELDRSIPDSCSAASTARRRCTVVRRLAPAVHPGRGTSAKLPVSLWSSSHPPSRSVIVPYLADKREEQ